MNHRDDSQIAMRIATAAAMFSVTGFLAYSILVDSLHYFSVPPFCEVLIKSIIVVLAIVFVDGRVRESQTVQNSSQIPFLSTVFFYGLSLLCIYVGQIVFICFHLFLASHVNFMSEMRFLMGVGEMSVSGILGGILAGHVPYLVYFFFLKFQLRNDHKKSP